MKTTHNTTDRSLAPYLALVLPLIAALAVRLLAWYTLPYRTQISDEGEYLAAATWLAQGRGFSFYKDWIWTRPPVYLLFLAAHIKLFGPTHVVPIRISQALLSVVSVGLTMALGALLAARGRERRVALLAGWIMAISYSFATYAFLVLSETLFVTLLLLGLVLLTLWSQRLHTHRGLTTTALLVGGGIALGLGALTRALLAGAMPLFALYIWWHAAHAPSGIAGRSGAQQPWRAIGRGLLPAILFTCTVLAVILPWTVYNSRFFATGPQHGLILIDTTGAYNAMLGVQAGRNETRVYETLHQVPDQATRQALAYRTAWQWIAENPTRFALKTGRELLDLVMINYGGAERLRSGHTQGAIPIPHLLLLLLDHTIYFLVAPLAVAGLVRRQGRPGKGLAVAWLGYNLVTGPLFFAIDRFRVPLLPLLMIYAACAVTQWRMPWWSVVRQRVAYAGAAGLFVLLLPSFVYWPHFINAHDSSVLQNTYLGIRSRLVAADCDRATAALERGDIAAAQRFVDRGSAYQNSAGNGLDCFALAQAQIDVRRNEPQPALALLQSMKLLPERFLLEGEIYRSLGDEQRAFGAFVARELETANPTAWAWKHLQDPPARRIDLGSGFDWGSIDGFYGREGRAEDPGNYRWTREQARLRFTGAGTGQPQVLRLRVAGGARLPSEPPAQLVVGASKHVFDLRPEWQEIEIPLPATQPGGDVIVELGSTVIVPGPEDLLVHQGEGAGEQLRLLGVQIDWAELR